MKNRKLGNKYEIIERLGRGGMAEVYRAHHVSLDRFVAIKVLHDFLADDPEFKSRFEKEARNIARLKHPHVVQVYDFEYDPVNESYYMVMELIDGFTLKDMLYEADQAGIPLPLHEALRITKEAASALAYAHKAGMIHRDVKPANLILDRNEGNRVVLTDFGIAKMVTSAQFTVTGGLIGTPAYMSPEQGVGETGDERSDIYSLGVILYQMITGDLPYEADTPLALILKHLNDPIPSACALNKQLPEWIDHIIARAIAKEPTDRYQKAGDLIEDIDRLESTLKGGEGNAHELTVSQSVSKSKRSEALDGPTQPYVSLPPTSSTTTREGIDTVSVDPTSNRGVWLFLGLMIVAVMIVGGYVLGAANGVFPAVGFLASATPTETNTILSAASPATDEIPIVVDTITSASSATPTASQTRTETTTATLTSTRTATNTLTVTASPTMTSTATSTVVISSTPTPNMTQTLSVERTLTVAACTFDYAIIEQMPEEGEEGGFFPINQPYERTIKLLNTGTCPWERNTSLTFINGTGESFNAGPRIFIRESVEVGDEIDLIFQATLPSRGSTAPISGTWQLRTPGQIPIGEPMIISVMVYDPGT